MLNIKYGIFAEDLPIKETIKHLTEYICNYRNSTTIINVEADINYSLIYGRNLKGKNKENFMKNYLEAASLAFSEPYNLNLLILCTDSDSPEKQIFENTFYEIISNLKSELHIFSEKIVIAIPVQCIEHWLWYIKLMGNNQLKGKCGKLEIKNCKDYAKKFVYEDVAKGSRKRKKIISGLLMNIGTKELEELKRCSYSFSKFNNDLNNIFCFIEKKKN